MSRFGGGGVILGGSENCQGGLQNFTGLLIRNINVFLISPPQAYSIITLVG